MCQVRCVQSLPPRTSQCKFRYSTWILDRWIKKQIHSLVALNIIEYLQMSETDVITSYHWLHWVANGMDMGLCPQVTLCNWQWYYEELVYSAKNPAVCKASTGCQAHSHFVDEETEAGIVKNEQVKTTNTFSRLYRWEV